MRGVKKTSLWSSHSQGWKPKTGIPDSGPTEGLGKAPLAQVLGAVVLGDWTSYYVALLNGVDPSPVEAIEELKRRLSDPRQGRQENA